MYKSGLEGAVVARDQRWAFGRVVVTYAEFVHVVPGSAIVS